MRGALGRGSGSTRKCCTPFDALTVGYLVADSTDRLMSSGCSPLGLSACDGIFGTPNRSTTCPILYTRRPKPLNQQPYWAAPMNAMFRLTFLLAALAATTGCTYNRIAHLSGDGNGDGGIAVIEGWHHETLLSKSELLISQVDDRKLEWYEFSTSAEVRPGPHWIVLLSRWGAGLYPVGVGDVNAYGLEITLEPGATYRIIEAPRSCSQASGLGSKSLRIGHQSVKIEITSDGKPAHIITVEALCSNTGASCNVNTTDGQVCPMFGPGTATRCFPAGKRGYGLCGTEYVE